MKKNINSAQFMCGPNAVSIMSGKTVFTGTLVEV